MNKQLYLDWLQQNRIHYCRLFNLFIPVLWLGLIPFDFLIYGPKADFFTDVRIKLLPIMLGSALLAWVVHRQIIKIPPFLTIVNTLIPLFVFLGAYLYFLADASYSAKFWVLLASIMTNFMGCIIVYRFATEQTLFSLGWIVGASALYLMGKFDQREAVFMIISAAVGWGTAWIFRRVFILGLENEYRQLLYLVPKSIANHLTTTSREKKIEEVFKPENRFTVCLCSDWRNYQDIISKEQPSYVIHLFERFYEITFQQLEKTAPKGNYYINWTADELFVVFFGKEEEKKQVLQDALQFAHSLTNEVFETVKKEFHFTLWYDIGLAAGPGFIGLQGPKHLKKTTVTGEVAGRAKRLENEAKRYRRELGKRVPPIIVMDPALSAEAEIMPFFKEGSFGEILATSKNVRNQKFIAWTANREVKDVEELEVAS